MQRHTDTSTLEPLVEKLAYRASLDAEDRAAIMALPFILTTMKRDQMIVREGELATHCCVVLSGYAVRSKLVGTGKRQILAVHMKGEVVDLQSSLLKVADHSVEMLTSGDVAMIPRENVVRLTLERPTIARAMWVDTLVDASIFREWIANVGRRNARTRVAHLLCEFSLRLKSAGLGEETRYDLPMTQEQVADATGLTSVHVNRSLKALEAEGLILRPSARVISIGDWRRLAAAGDFDSNYLHMRQDDLAFA
ncbi:MULTISPECIES: Crp/Fnr family transcriptional regulator [Sphingomonas]|uniref:Crp/Fnr family transcriptional regulator n=1 Tax=Sphingomonas TaxID=13687 RepID=UPI001F0863E8|nr:MULTISPECIES: Crp/Fnr family transcriptional regulator [Sphingomonas]